MRPLVALGDLPPELVEGQLRRRSPRAGFLTGGAWVLILLRHALHSSSLPIGTLDHRKNARARHSGGGGCFRLYSTASLGPCAGAGRHLMSFPRLELQLEGARPRLRALASRKPQPPNSFVKADFQACRLRVAAAIVLDGAPRGPDGAGGADFAATARLISPPSRVVSSPQRTCFDQRMAATRRWWKIPDVHERRSQWQ